MPFSFEATDDFNNSIKTINTLVKFAEDQGNLDNEENRILFLKLAIVSIVTKFQVYIEKVLKEYQYVLKTSNKNYKHISIHLRLNAIKIYTSEKIIHMTLENPETYSNNKLNEIRDISKKTLAFCDDNEIIDGALNFETKFPLGKTGLNELIKLFKQINGEDIFKSTTFDINRLNEILGKRHAIIHEDSNPQITESTVEKYRDYIKEVVKYIDHYLSLHK